MKIQVKPQVNSVPPAESPAAQAYFARKLTFETDCWDVHHDISNNVADFVLIDVRSPALYKQGHALGAINIPHSIMTEKRMAEYPLPTRFVVYCTGSGCNGADKGALRLSQLGRPVKIMIGGMVTWEYTEKFPVVRDE